MKETELTCPHGHTNIRRRVGATKRSGSMYGPKRVPVAKSEYYCRTCADKRAGRYIDPHYEKVDLIERKRRVNDEPQYDVSLGYVWSPSHDEIDA